MEKGQSPPPEAIEKACRLLQQKMETNRRWAERYYNLKRWTVMPSGGHFAPMEEPQRLVEDIRTFFRDLR